MDNCHPGFEPDKFAKQLSQRLRVLRNESGLSQEAIASRAGISTYTYQKFEKGESKPGTPMNPRISTMFALANVFDIDICDLLKPAPEKQPDLKRKRS